MVEEKHFNFMVHKLTVASAKTDKCIEFDTKASSLHKHKIVVCNHSDIPAYIIVHINQGLVP